MTIADKLTLLANTKEALRAKLKISKSIPFSKYPDYVNWNTAPSIPNKAFYADFTNDRYVKDGVPCNFKDLFTFTRAGKAWLVKDTGLQEHAADVPRFDNGLLLEESRTNNYTSRGIKLDVSVGGTVSYSGQTPIAEQLASKFTEDTTGGRHYARWDVPKINERQSFSVYAKAVNVDYLHFGYSQGQSTKASVNMKTLALALTSGTSEYYLGLEKVVQANKEWVRLSSEVKIIPAMGMTAQVYTSDSASSLDSIGKGGSYYLWGCQIEIGEGATSYILPTNDTATTRPADFLLNKITGTTVTGDWDSTLNLSIVAGKLVHSGYGKIRSLEIN